MGENYPDISETSRQTAPLDLSGARVLVTGANGFIGRPLVARLLRARAQVTVLLRSAHGRRYFQADGARVVICPLVGGPALNAAVAGHSVLFHFAYDVRASGAQNVAAFSALYDAARQNGIARIIHASSAVVYDHWPNGQINEESPVSTDDGGDYRQAKIAMEQILMSGNIAAAILQPTIVYGPGSALWSAAPQAALRRGPVVLPDPPGICPAVHVGDVVTAALRAATVAELGRERFILTGPDRLSWADFYQGHARLIKTGSVQLVPVVELRSRLPPPDGSPSSTGPSLAARISARLRRIIGNQRFDWIISALRARLSGTGPVFPPPHMMPLYTADLSISSEHALSRLGYRPETDLQTGLSADVKSG